MLNRSNKPLLSVIGCALLLLAGAAGCSAPSGAPAISNVWPATIVPGRTQTLTIEGQGFKNGASVTFGAPPGKADALVAPAVWVNEHYVSAGVPSGIAASGSRYSVLVTNPDGQSAISPQVVLIGATATAAATPVATKAALLTPTPTRAVPTPPPPTLPPPTEPPSPTASPTPTPLVLPLQPPSTPTPVDQPPVVIPTTPTAVPPAAETATPTPAPPATPSSEQTIPSIPVQPVRPSRRGTR